MIASKCHSVGGSVVAEVSRVKGEHWGALGHRREGPLCATHGGNQLHTPVQSKCWLGEVHLLSTLCYVEPGTSAHFIIL